MTDFLPKIALATLHKRTSQNGRTYFSGFLGKAKVMLFEDDKADRPEWSEGVFTLFVQEQPVKDAAKTQKPASQRQEPFQRQRVDVATMAAYEARKAAKNDKPAPVERDPMIDDELPWSP
jgi:hypothetical protein